MQTPTSDSVQEEVPTVPCDPVSLYKLFEQIHANAETDSIIKSSMEEVNKKIFEKIKDTDYGSKLFQTISLTDLVDELCKSVSRMNCKQTNAILDTKRIPANAHKLSVICTCFTYSSTTDELAHEMLKMLTDYGFDWKCAGNAPCIYSINNNEFPKVIALLLDLGLDVNTKLSLDRGTLIEYSVYNDRHKISQLLIERGATVTEATRAKLPAHLRKLLDERTTDPEIKMITDEVAAFAKLTQKINKITNHPSFITDTITITDIYHRSVNRFISQYNPQNNNFVLAFDPATATLSVQWKD